MFLFTTHDVHTPSIRLAAKTRATRTMTIAASANHQRWLRMNKILPVPRNPRIPATHAEHDAVLKTEAKTAERLPVPLAVMDPTFIVRLVWNACHCMSMSNAFAIASTPKRTKSRSCIICNWKRKSLPGVIQTGSAIKRKKVAIARRASDGIRPRGERVVLTARTTLPVSARSRIATW